jgi:hypothetical protein
MTFKDFTENLMNEFKSLNLGFKFVRVGLNKVINIKIDKTIYVSFGIKGTEPFSTDKNLIAKFIICSSGSVNEYERDIYVESIASELLEVLISLDMNELIVYENMDFGEKLDYSLFEIQALFKLPS